MWTNGFRARFAGARAPERQKKLRQKSNFPKPINADSSVQSLTKKYFAYHVGQIRCIDPAVSRSTRGAYRDRHGRWTRDVMDVFGARTNAPDADGEAVWSWHLDADAKRAGRFRP
jgi:hypothetical protein